MSPFFLGLEIGGTKLQVAVGQGSAQLVECRRLAVDPGQGADGIRAAIAKVMPAMLDRWQPRGVAVGFGGPVDRRTGRVVRSHQIEGWSDFDLGGWLHELTRLPVAVENDSNTAALAEATFGAGAGFDPVFYFNLGSGVGGGLVCDGHIHHGRPPGEMEFGHLRLDRSGATVEDRCSGWAIDQRLRAAAAARPDGILARLLEPQPTVPAQHLVAAADAGDPDATTILESLAADLAFALSHVVHLLHPGAMVMGGGLAELGEPLRAAIASRLPDHVMPAFRAGLELRLAAGGREVVPLGALRLARLTADAR